MPNPHNFKTCSNKQNILLLSGEKSYNINSTTRKICKNLPWATRQAELKVCMFLCLLSPVIITLLLLWQFFVCVHFYDEQALGPYGMTALLTSVPLTSSPREKRAEGSPQIKPVPTTTHIHTFTLYVIIFILSVGAYDGFSFFKENNNNNNRLLSYVFNNVQPCVLLSLSSVSSGGYRAKAGESSQQG